MTDAMDWRWAGPDRDRMPFLQATWLPKIKVEPAPQELVLDGPCWLWLGGRDSDGYSVVWVGKRDIHKYWSLHRWMFRHWYNAEIEPGFHIDHFCFRRNCFQFGHLRKLDAAVNRQRFQGNVEKAQDLLPEDLAALADGYWLTR